MVKEKTFALMMPYAFNEGFLGLFLDVFEKSGLTVVGLKRMSVNKKFAEFHLSRPGRIPSHPVLPEDVEHWIHVLGKGSVIALLFEGENAIQVAQDCLVKEIDEDLCAVPYKFTALGTIYISALPESALEDIELRFLDVADELKDDYLKKDLIFVLPDKICGKEENIQELKYFYYWSSQRLILIRPVAVQMRIAGEIIAGFEYTSGIMSGFKLVNVSDLPAHVRGSVDSSSSGTANDDYGIAMFFESYAAEYINLIDNGGSRCVFDHKTRVLDVDKELIYISESGPKSWELAVKCFPFGFVVKTENPRKRGILEAGLIGL